MKIPHIPKEVSSIDRITTINAHSWLQLAKMLELARICQKLSELAELVSTAQTAPNCSELLKTAQNFQKISQNLPASYLA